MDQIQLKSMDALMILNDKDGYFYFYTYKKNKKNIIHVLIFNNFITFI